MDTGSLFTGAAGADTFNGIIANVGAANSAGTTLQAGDALNGGAGTDTLSISVSGGDIGANAAVSLAGIERVMVNNVNGAAQSISMALVDSALTTVGHSASNTNSVTTFTGLNKIVDSELSNGDAGITLTYNAAVVAGLADASTLTLAGQTGGTFTSDGIETLNVVSNTLANTVTLGTSHTAVNVSGAANLTLGAVPASVATLNAAAFTGNLTATLSSLATQVVTGGTGNDTITAGTNLTGVGAVNAGDGTDTLVTTADAVIAVAADGARYTNFETLSVRTTGLGATATRTQDMSQVAGITTTNVTSARANGIANDTAHDVTLSNLSATMNTLNVTGLQNADADGADDFSVTVIATRAVNTTADAITVNLGTATAVSGATVGAVGSTVVGSTILALSLVNEETITINSLGATGSNFLGAITNTAATSMVFTGARALSFASLSGTATTSIDASAMTAAFVMGTNAGAVASTITGGTGNDVLTGGSAADNIVGGAGADSISGAAGADVISGGDGNDTIVGGAGIDNLSGGAGNDTFSVTTTTDFIGLAAAETVSGGDGTDNLSFAENVVITVAAADLLAISGIERITINGTANAGSVTLTDAVYTANGATTLAIVDGLLTGGGLTVNASALTAANSVQVTANTTATVTDSLVGGAGADTFTFATVAGLEAADTVTGGAGIDTINLTATADVTANLSGVSGVENITTVGTGAGVNAVIVVGADAVIAVSGTLTTNASSMTSGGTSDLNYDGSLITTATKIQNITGTAGADTIVGGNGNDIIVGGEGADVITGGAGIDNLSGGAGTDTFIVAATGAGFTGLVTAETVSGGAGNDTLQFAAGTLVIAAADLVNVSGVEIIQILNTTETAGLTLTDAWFTANGTTAVAVNSSTATTGVLTFAASTLSAANSIQLNLSATNNGAANVINMGAGNDTLTIDLQALNNTTTLSGGAGNDTLIISANTLGANITQDATITGWENISFLTAGIAGTFATTVNDAGVAAGATQTINGSNLTGTLNFVGTAELDGKFAITGGAGADTLIGGSLVDTIVGGAGADVITGGLGADVLTGGIGIDTFVYAAVAQSNSTNTDTITDWTSGTDKLQVTLDYSTLVNAVDVNATRVSAGVAGTSLAQDALSGQRGQFIYDTSAGNLFINVNADNLLTSADYRIALSPASTATATVVDGDIDFVITGGTNGDVIVAGGGADTIDGAAGADNITGGAGADSLTGGLDADTIDGGAGADTIVGGAGADVLGGGLGDDVFVYAGLAELIAANAVIDLVDGGAGTADAIRLDGATTIVAADLLARITNVEKITAGATTGIISITATAVAGTFTSTAFNEINLSGDTNTTGTNVVSITGVTGITSITGSAGIDQIALGADAVATIVTGGLGVDTYNLGNALGATVVIASVDTGATYATADKITGFTTGDDILKLGVAGTVANFATANGAATEAAAIIAANTALNGVVKYYLATAIVANLGGGANLESLLFIDADMDGTYDDMIALVGIAGVVVSTDIIA